MDLLRLRIIGEWKSDEEGWWDIIGPGGATYGDVFNGTRLVLDKPTSTIQGTFFYDSEDNTFYFRGKETFLEMPGEMGYGYLDQNFNSLTEFYETASDIIWLRPADNGELVYQGGTGYAAGGSEVQWGNALNTVKHGTCALGFGIAGLMGALEPTGLAKALAVVAFFKCGDEAIKTNQFGNGFTRSVSTSIRLQDLQTR